MKKIQKIKIPSNQIKNRFIQYKIFKKMYKVHKTLTILKIQKQIINFFNKILQKK